MHLVLVNCIGGLSLPGNSMVRLTDHPDRTMAVYRGEPVFPRKWAKTELAIASAAAITGLGSSC